MNKDDYLKIDVGLSVLQSELTTKHANEIIRHKNSLDSQLELTDKFLKTLDKLKEIKELALSFVKE